MSTKIARMLMQDAPSFPTPAPPVVAPTDVVGPIMNKYAADVAQWQTGVQADQQRTGALVGLGATLLSAGMMPGGFLAGLFSSPLAAGTAATAGMSALRNVAGRR